MFMIGKLCTLFSRIANMLNVSLKKKRRSSGVLSTSAFLTWRLYLSSGGFWAQFLEDKLLLLKNVRCFLFYASRSCYYYIETCGATVSFSLSFQGSEYF